MMLLLFLLLWLVSLTIAPTPQPAYPIPARAVNIPHDEPRTEFEFPFPATKLGVARSGAKFMAHLFAGKAEFPFVVKVKATEYAPCDDPANTVLREFQGLLITTDFLLTTCRSVGYITCEEKDQSHFDPFPQKGDPLPNPIGIKYNVPIFPGTDKVDPPTFVCPDIDLRITPCAPNIFVVKYATVYLYEDNKYTDRFGHYSRDITNQFSGDRHVAEIILHPQCRPWDTLENDVAILKMTAPLNPAGTWLGFPTFPINARGLIERVDLGTDLQPKSKACYITGYNSDYAGMLGDDQITRHFKVKFRSYPIDMKYCESYVKIICFGKPLVVMRACWLWFKRYHRMVKYEIETSGIECWGTRNKVGAVCDSHAGAPLVCDGMTHGFVLRAADWARCNNMYRMPFIVGRLFAFQDFFVTQILDRRSAYEPEFFRPDDQPPRDYLKSSAKLSKIGLSLYMWAFLLTLLVLQL